MSECFATSKVLDSLLVLKLAHSLSLDCGTLLPADIAVDVGMDDLVKSCHRYAEVSRHKTAWLAVNWVNWSAQGKLKWTDLTYIG